jgi:hypothetical protein
VKAGVDRALADAANDQKVRWKSQLPGDAVVYVGTPTLTSQGSLADAVGKEVATFDVPVTASVQGFAVAGDQPAKAAIEQYRPLASEGMVLDERSAQFAGINAPTVADNGVTWRLTVSGQQSPRVDSARIRSTLAGRTPADARSVLEALGLKVNDLRVSPAWWPRMPLLDLRIAVNN